MAIEEDKNMKEKFNEEIKKVGKKLKSNNQSKDNIMLFVMGCIVGGIIVTGSLFTYTLAISNNNCRRESDNNYGRMYNHNGDNNGYRHDRDNNKNNVKENDEDNNSSNNTVKSS